MRRGSAILQSVLERLETDVLDVNRNTEPDGNLLTLAGAALAIEAVLDSLVSSRFTEEEKEERTFVIEVLRNLENRSTMPSVQTALSRAALQIKGT